MQWSARTMHAAKCLTTTAGGGDFPARAPPFCQTFPLTSFFPVNSLPFSFQTTAVCPTFSDFRHRTSRRGRPPHPRCTRAYTYEGTTTHTLKAKTSEWEMLDFYSFLSYSLSIYAT